jgi:CBS domain containing-hemolysin-like protein
LELAAIAVIVLVLLFFAVTDHAFSQMSDLGLRRLSSDADEGSKQRTFIFLRTILDNRPGFRFVISVIIQILLIVLTVLITIVLLHYSEDRSGLLLWSLAIAISTTLIFRQVIPRLIVGGNPESKLLFLLPIIRPLFAGISVITAPFAGTSNMSESLRSEITATPESLEERIEDSGEDFQALMEVGEAEGILEGNERELIESMVEFSETRAGEIMTPRTELCAIPVTATVRTARDLIIEEKYSRLPVYRDNIDNIEGAVYVRDLLSAWSSGDEDAPITSILRDAFFVPETKSAAELLKQMQADHIQLAIVIDEYGGVAGIVTVEDILEEIVGEIEDEDIGDEEIVEIIEGDDGYFEMVGSTEIDKIERLFDIEITEQDFTTIAGLVTSEAGYVPKVGECLIVHGLEVEIVSADEKKLTKLRVRRMPEQDDETDNEQIK